MEELSDCCNATVKVDCSDDFKAGDSEYNQGCTCCYVCTKCGKVCNIKPKEEKVMTKEEFIKYMNTMVGEDMIEFIDEQIKEYMSFMKNTVIQEAQEGGVEDMSFKDINALAGELAIKAFELQLKRLKEKVND